MMHQLLIEYAHFIQFTLFSDESKQQVDDFGVSPSWDDENGFDDAFDNGNFHSDIEDSSTLVSQPRQVGIHNPCIYVYPCTWAGI